MEVEGFRVGRPLLMKINIFIFSLWHLKYVLSTYAAFTLPRPLVDPELLL